MPVRNPNWYSLQSTRRYPLDDRATGTGDDGERLKDDILADCQLRWPQAAGEYAYIGSINVTPRIVTVTILAAASPDAADVFTPLAVVSLPQPVERHVHYSVTPWLPGTGGFLVFGDVTEPFSARFSTPRQGLLLLRCAQAYPSPPVTSLRKYGRADGLDGLVKLVAGSDLQLVKESRTVGGQLRDVLVLRLGQSVAPRNVLEVYRGTCGNRPESRTCDKEGIEAINDVLPDCNGNLNIRFEGLAAAPYDGCDSLAAGITLDQSLGLDDMCLDTAPGRFGGTDYCSSESASSLSSEGV